jgi:hypothetical protein
MKTCIPLLLTAICTSTTPALALQIGDLLGTWTGKHQETQSGSGFAYKTSLKGNKLPGGTIRLTERGALYPYASTYTFHNDGKFTSRTTSAGGSIIYSTYKGTWVKRNGRIALSANGTDGKLSGSISETATGFRFTGNTDHLDLVISARR